MLQGEKKDAWNTALISEMISRDPQRRRSINRCSVCHKTYSTKGALQRHVRYECGVEPQFRCHLCSRRFCHNYHLKTHLILHKGHSGSQ